MAYDFKSLANLILWYDFGDADTVSVTGTDFDSITNKKDSGVVQSLIDATLTPVSTSNPQYPVLVNGRNALDFDGSLESIGSPTFDVQSGSFTFLCVFVLDTVAAINTLLHGTNDPAQTTTLQAYVDASGQVQINRGGTAPTPSNDVTNMLSYVVTMACTYSTTDSDVFINDVSNVLTGAQNVGTENLNQVFIGGEPDLANALNGRMCECAIVKRVMSDTELMEWFEYANAKWRFDATYSLGGGGGGADPIMGSSVLN